MQQIHLFDSTLAQRIEETINEPVEDYFVTSSFLISENNHLRYCKVLTKKYIYDVTVSEDYGFDSVVNHKADRKKFHKKNLNSYFKKNHRIFKSNFVQ